MYAPVMICSSVKPDQFQCLESVSLAVTEINRHLCEVSEMDMDREICLVGG